MRIALVGFRRTGKDEVARALCRHYSYIRRSVGDFIKGDLDPLVRAHFGFSAFTEVHEEKEKIRPILEVWGMVNNESILKRFYSSLPITRVVNGRVQTVTEAEQWAAAGGMFTIVRRPECGPASRHESETVGHLMEVLPERWPSRLAYIENSGTLDQLLPAVDKAVMSLHTLAMQNSKQETQT